MQKKPRYHVSDDVLKRLDAKWIPGYEGRYASSEKNEMLYYPCATNTMAAKCHDGYNTAEGRIWNCTVNYSNVRLTSISIKKLFEGYSLSQEEKEKYVSLQNDTYAVGRVVADVKKCCDRIEIVAINLDSATARDMAKELTIKELNKFVIFSIDAIVNYKVVTEVIV